MKKDIGKQCFLVLVILLLLAVVFLCPEEKKRLIPINPRLEKVIAELEKMGFQKAELEKIFSDPQLRIYPDIPKLKGKKVDYFSEEFGLFSSLSLQRGREFINRYWLVFTQAEQKFGVSKEVIVAILRLESDFGRVTGRRKLINTFYSMIIQDFRTDFAERELINLFLISRKNKRDIFSYYGSFMGAFGMPQFLPSSYLKFAVDGNSDGRVDLNNVEDAIFSVANYLKSHGWGESFYRQYKSVYSYNHDNSYVLVILMYAAMLR